MHVRQQRCHQRVFRADGQGEQGAVRLRDAQSLGLGPFHAAIAEEPAVQAGGVQVLVAEHAGAVGERKRHHHQIARLQRVHLRADVFDDADGLVAHALRRLAIRHQVVGPQVAAADTRAGHAHDRVGRLLNP